MQKSDASLQSQKFRGWLLDLYPSNAGEMTLWFITELGDRVKLVDKYLPKIYVAGESDALSKLTGDFAGSQSVAAWRFAEKYVNPGDLEKSKVLEIDITDARRIPFFARKILRLGSYRRFKLGNVDLPDAQRYLYDHDIFPLSFLEVQAYEKHIDYILLDSVKSEKYAIPELRRLVLTVEISKAGKIPSLNDPIKRIILIHGEKEVMIDKGDEREKILNFISAVRESDPDIIFTKGGDSTLFPYLARRALINDVLGKFVLGREDVPFRAKMRRGITYFSYGRVYFRAPMRRLYGRVHIDFENTFIYSDSGLEGLIEVSRTCRVPLHRAARASIGTIMSSLQLYQAMKDDILVPWKKSEPETFKSAWELLVADRGGFIFEPKVGLHFWVGELDFASMYPTLMANNNISGETVLCSHCQNSKIRVPELGYNICEKKVGIVPKALRLILKKRADYKQLRNESENKMRKEVYDRRQSALKWILVTSFGYLGYRNAKFGRIDAHIAVCAFARDALLRTMRIAEDQGFHVVHGLVDSLWLKKENATPREFVDISRDISKDIGVRISFEGRYRWIVFLPSRTHQGVPVLNRYYGVYEDGKIKTRGIETRRSDTPSFIRRAQLNIIKTLAKAKDVKRFNTLLPSSVKVLKGYVNDLLKGDVARDDLVISKRLSMNPREYVQSVFQVIAARQLEKAGVEVSAGQSVKYLITDAKNSHPNRRVKAYELLGEEDRYDREKYLELLLSGAANILSPFGYSKEKLVELTVAREKQLLLGSS